MDRYFETAAAVVAQLFGPDSAIPPWAWLFVLLAVFWKLVVPEPRTAEDRDEAMLSAMYDGKDGKKKRRKK